ncbi:hypothetical protein ACPV5L_15370 [Vibrio astriarenae]
MKLKLTLNEVFTLVIALISIGLASYSLHLSLKAKTPKLSIETEQAKCSGDKDCFKVFVFNNDDAPCFEFTLEYAEEIGQAFYMQGYEKSSLFNSSVMNNMVVFPPMMMIPLNRDNGKSWLGFLDNKQIAYFTFVPKASMPTKSKLKVTCVGFEEVVQL